MGETFLQQEKKPSVLLYFAAIILRDLIPPNCSGLLMDKKDWYNPFTFVTFVDRNKH